MGIRRATEAEIELQILGHLTFQRRHFAIKNPSAGYYDAKIQRFRKHTNPYALNGSPDIYCWIKNVPHLKSVVVSFEVKTPVGTQSDDQLSFEARVTEAGGYYFVVRCIGDVDAALISIGALQ